MFLKCPLVFTYVILLKILIFHFFVLGFVGLLGALGYGVYAYKTRGPAMTTSRYLMRLRVIAQSMVVGSIILGVGITQLSKEKR